MDWPPSTDPATPQWAPSQIYGPRFISNLEGLVLEISSNPPGEVVSSKFSGERTQQWVFQPNHVNGNVSLVSLHDGTYLSLDSSGRVVVANIPFEWHPVPDGAGRYSLRATTGDNPHLSLPTPPGTCSAHLPWAATEAQTRLILLENTSDNRKALKTGSIGQFAYSQASAYYTYTTAGQIIVRNHLDTKLYGAVSGSGSNSQWTIEPGKEVLWHRSGNERIHISTPTSDTGEQSAQVYNGRVGMTLHIQNLGRQETWRGVRSVMVEDATYTENPTKPTSIGIQNDLEFDIFASVFRTLQNGDTNQWRIAPKSTSYWSRTSPESVFVGVGSAPGLPQAYVGRPGFILHIEDWRPTGTH